MTPFTKEELIQFTKQAQEKSNSLRHPMVTWDDHHAIEFKEALETFENGFIPKEAVFIGSANKDEDYWEYVAITKIEDNLFHIDQEICTTMPYKKSNNLSDAINLAVDILKVETDY